jgi:hypothetical protein
LSTKIHLTSDDRARPMSRIITPGQRYDAVVFEPVMAGIRIRRGGRGRPRTRPDRVLCDKAYSNRRIRTELRRRWIKTIIPERIDQQAHRARKGSQGGRPPQFDPETTKAARLSSAASTSSNSFAPWPPVTTTRIHLPRHRRRRLDQNLAPRSRTIHRTRSSVGSRTQPEQRQDLLIRQ